MRDRRRSVLAVGVVCIAAALLVGCAPEVDAATSREALQEVTAEPAPPEDIDPYDAEAFPEPIVDALDCSPYLVITARGTGEPKRKQLLAPVARAISEARPGEVDRLDLDYPADTEINAGGTLGARTLIDTLNVQAEACPEQATVLLGYSQGALVIGDALSEPETRLVGANVGVLSEAATEQLLVVVLYGNPRFVGSDPTGYGTFDPDLNGLLPRPPGGFEEYEDRLRDFCVADDFICQSTLAMEESGHVAYYDNGMQNDGAAFVIAHLTPASEVAAEDAASPSPGDATSTPRSTASPESDSRPSPAH